MRIVFFGTPDFAVATLKALVENGLNVVAVVTAPDKPAGRGMKLQMPAVKKYAADQHLPVLQPEKLKDAGFIAALHSYQADVQVVVAFRMLPEMVWNMPLHGTINLHASLLPQYRGAAPINWAIIRGEQHTGVTTFRLQHAIDTGNILMQQRVDIDRQETAGTLHDKLMTVGANLMVKTLQGLENNSITEMPQHT
ncbi:MAG: methionyl-tRNA formyltransferase, partial [Chitinophagaceae bacterium]|nr:methionyl-tRNA formyltransferase [Chitinophagaceae bacterium]